METTGHSKDRGAEDNAPDVCSEGRGHCPQRFADNPSGAQMLPTGQQYFE